MFKNVPQVLAHKSALNTGSFVTPNYILSKNGDEINALSRMCPHRYYPIGEEGETLTEITCKFHGFTFDSSGKPLNNNLRLACTETNIGRSGLVFKNFVEPEHKWVDDLANEKNLVYSHSWSGTSKGSWLWIMEAEADMLHIRKGGIHPWLSENYKPEEVILEQGDGWICQSPPHGWWLYIYPYTFVEWDVGRVAVNYTIPHDKNSEYGFDWISQFYYDPNISSEQRKTFEMFEDVFKEDVEAIEKQMRPYTPLAKTFNAFEDHTYHFGDWVTKYKNKL